MRRALPLLLLFALLVPSLAVAQTDEFSRLVQFKVTKYGELLNAHGAVMIERTGKGIEIFTLAVEANVPNRSMLTVSAMTKRGVFVIAPLRTLLGMGTMEVWDTIEPSEVFPLDELIWVRVRDGKWLMLEATF